MEDQEYKTNSSTGFWTGLIENLLEAIILLFTCIF